MAGDEERFDIEESLEELRVAMARIQEMTDQADAEFAAERVQLDGMLGSLEEERRTGRCGRDWQILQQRIDLKETTLDDIVGGLDLSDEAIAVRAQMSAALPQLRDGYVAVLEDPETEGGAAQAEHARAELLRAIDELNESLRRL